MNNATKRRIRSDKKYLEREPELLSRLSEDERKLAYAYRDFCQNTTIDDLDGEVWYDVPKWEGLYQVSNFLRLKSVRYNEIRKPRINYKHYFDTCFHIGGKPKYLIYSRIVASVFHPNPYNLPEVNHKNGIRWDNRPSNIEWATSKKNTAHSIGVLGNVRSKKSIVQLKMDGCFLRGWDSISDAAKSVGKPGANITTVCKGGNDYAYGYIWMYKEDYELNGLKNRYIQKKYKKYESGDTTNS